MSTWWCEILFTIKDAIPSLNISLTPLYSYSNCIQFLYCKIVQRHWHFRSKNCPSLSIQYGLLLYLLLFICINTTNSIQIELSIWVILTFQHFSSSYLFSFRFALFTNSQRLLLLRALLLLPLAYQMCDTWNMDSITAINAWVELIFIVTLTLNFWRATYDDDNSDDFTHFMVYFYLSRFIFSSTFHFILVTINLLGWLICDCQKMKKVWYQADILTDEKCIVHTNIFSKQKFEWEKDQQTNKPYVLRCVLFNFNFQWLS